MADWDEDSQRLLANMLRVQEAAARHARQRHRITLEDLREWHRIVMQGLDIAEAAELGIDAPHLIGNFRGSARLIVVETRVGEHDGVPSDKVASQCHEFIARLQALLAALDDLWPQDRLGALTEDGLHAVAKVAAWAHGEWVRIHPFANGNGRTARLLANTVLERYGLPPVVRTRPRPMGSYVIAAALGAGRDHAAMQRFIVTQILLRTSPRRR